MIDSSILIFIDTKGQTAYRFLLDFPLLFTSSLLPQQV